MATANLNYKELLVNDGLEGIVIVRDLGDIPGGRSLDCSGVDDGTEVIKSGHVLVQDSKGNVSPLGVTDGAYGSLPDGYSYVGVLKASVLVSDPRAAVLTMGQVNAAASPYPVTDEIKAALPAIQFLYA